MELRPLGAFNGWAACETILTNEQVDLACAAYRECLVPPVPDPIRRAFEADGEPIEQFLLAEEESDETLTRSDITELVAAASLMNSDNVDGRFIELPNVPKRSRAVSEHGTDFVALRLSTTDAQTAWGPEDMLFVGSVKHTTADPDDLRRKLVASIGKGMPRRRLRGEVRVLVDQLSRSGIDARRAFVALLSFPDPTRVTLIGVAVVAPAHHESLVAGFEKLPAHKGGRRILAVVVEDLGQLHARVA